MSPEYPYQLVAFFNDEPIIGEGAYQGEKGWYPQIALKRRFSISGLSESELLSLLNEFAASMVSLHVQTGQLIKPDRMPVRVIEILNQKELKQFHLKFIDFMGSHMKSRYPDRDGEHYLPHITAEYDGKFVINPDQFTHKSYIINRLCLLKDEQDADSHVVSYFRLKES